LVHREELIYTYQYGCTFLEKSYAKPIRISSRIILSPSNRQIYVEPSEIVIKLQGGASFGTGDHPSTQLSIKGIEQALSRPHPKQISNGTCLDIGTGSGILVIAAILLGIHFGLGIDIDPNALYEAKHNVILNGLTHRITIEDTPIDLITGSFSVIMANLRFPTLIRFFPDIYRLLDNGGFVVMSGYKKNELPDIMETYTDGFKLLWSCEEKGWGGCFFQKTG
jgi:ribosomal protein L11 methyltransferase